MHPKFIKIIEEMLVVFDNYEDDCLDYAFEIWHKLKNDGYDIVKSKEE